MILYGHQSFREVVLWGWLKRFSLQCHFIHGLVTTRVGYEVWLSYDVAHHRSTPPAPSHRNSLSLDSTEREWREESRQWAQKQPRGLRFSLSGSKKALHPGKGRKASVVPPLFWGTLSLSTCHSLTGFSVREYFIPPCPSCATIARFRKGLPAIAFLSERFTDAIPHIPRVYYEYFIEYIILNEINIVKNNLTWDPRL